MDKLREAIRKIKEEIRENDVFWINKNLVSAENVLELYYANGIKRHFSPEIKVNIKNKRVDRINIAQDCMTQWQTIAYYHLITKSKFDEQIYMSFFYDLDLLVKKDLGRIDDFHNTCALLQVPDLPYEFVEHVSYFINKDGSYENEIKNIIEFIRNQIQKGYLVVPELDTYFVDCSEKYHDVLRYMVYGYDDFNELFDCIGFKGRRFEKFKISYENLFLAYEYSKIININAPLYIEIYRPLNEISTALSKNKQNGIEKLYAYYTSENKYSVLQAESKQGRWLDCEEYVGSRASMKFVELLDLMAKGMTEVCYQCIHAFYENKVMLWERGKYFVGEEKIEYLEKAKVEANIGRHLFMKYRVTENPDNIRDSILRCRKALEYEGMYLGSILKRWI